MRGALGWESRLRKHFWVGLLNPMGGFGWCLPMVSISHARGVAGVAGGEWLELAPTLGRPVVLQYSSAQAPVACYKTPGSWLVLGLVWFGFFFLKRLLH